MMGTSLRLQVRPVVVVDRGGAGEGKECEDNRRKCDKSLQHRVHRRAFIHGFSLLFHSWTFRSALSFSLITQNRHLASLRNYTPFVRRSVYRFSKGKRKEMKRSEEKPIYYFLLSDASPFLQAMILTFWEDTISLPSILNVASLMINVQTSSHRR